MRKTTIVLLLLGASVAAILSCSKKDTGAAAPVATYPAVEAAFGGKINLNALANYAAQGKPAYITKDNGVNNPVSDVKATLGRVLFYDKNLSIDNSVACASCHKQQFAFGDTAFVSAGVAGGNTGRHSMRLINARFANEVRFFWNERAATLEQQTTGPIQDHAEMGFSGQNGRPNLAALLVKLQNIAYYKELFQFAYGDQNISEARLQECLAQFVRSIQSFDSKYDAGRATAPNDGAPFANFTAQENQGKTLYLQPPQFGAGGQRTGGGLGCGGCHGAPEFDIDPQSRNNGIIATIGSNVIDVNNTRSPSLRDLMRADGTLNGPMMHTANFRTIQQVLGHYGNITVAPGNTNLDPRLRPGGSGQQLNLTAAEVNAVTAFLRTLSGTNVYTDTKWSDPFR
ncbi:MAG: cytochrome-c peroxidase [Chitinophagaceae bacterium]|nr:MAG: cytochrome-c peroxidase [Chitinophagaceae bacterium]